MRDFAQWLRTDILSLGMAADDARRASAPSPGVVTYLRVHPVTAGDLSAPGGIPDGASEVRLHDIPETLDAAVAQVQTVRARAGLRRIAAYSMADLEARAAAGWGPLEAVLSRLAAAGLSDVADMPVDRLPDLAASIRAAYAAGLHLRRLTVGAPVGERKLDLLGRIRACRSVLPHPVHVAPLPRQVPVDKPTTGYEDLRMIALSRLMLGAADDEHPPMHIEVDWSLYGPKLAQVALTFGADHLDSVSAIDDHSLGPRRSTLVEVERNIRAAGFEPRELRSPR